MAALWSPWRLFLAGKAILGRFVSFGRRIVSPMTNGSWTGRNRSHGFRPTKHEVRLIFRAARALRRLSSNECRPTGASQAHADRAKLAPNPTSLTADLQLRSLCERRQLCGSLLIKVARCFLHLNTRSEKGASAPYHHALRFEIRLSSVRIGVCVVGAPPASGISRGV